MPFLSALFWFMMGVIVGTTFPISFSPAFFGGLGFLLSSNHGNVGNLMRKTYLLVGIALMVTVGITGQSSYPLNTIVGLVSAIISLVWFYFPRNSKKK